MRKVQTLLLTLALSIPTAFIPTAAEAAREDWGISMGADLGVQSTGWVEADGVSPSGGGLLGAWAEWQVIPILAIRGGLRLTGGAGSGQGRSTMTFEVGPMATYWIGPLRLHTGIAVEAGGAAWAKEKTGAGGGGRLGLAPNAGLRFDIPIIPIDLGLGADARLSVAGIAGSGTALSATPMFSASVYYYF